MSGKRLFVWIILMVVMVMGFWLLRDRAKKQVAYNDISASELQAALENGDEYQVIDIRDAASYNRGHIAGAINVPMDSLRDRIDAIGRDKKVVLVCYSGHTSRMAAEFLVSRGYDNIWNMIGGMAAWRGPLSTQ